jgi:hypothetical protein
LALSTHKIERQPGSPKSSIFKAVSLPGLQGDATTALTTDHDLASIATILDACDMFTIVKYSTDFFTKYYVSS